MNKVVIAILISLGLVLQLSQQVFAQDVTSLRGLALSPLRTELEITPGTSQDGSLTVHNYSDKDIKVTFGAEEFGVTNYQYDYFFNAESSLANWVVFEEKRISLAAGDSHDVKFTIGVPLSAEPRGVYISIFASTDTIVSGSSVNSRQRVASLLYITVPGKVTRSGSLLSLTLPWLEVGGGYWSANLQNNGTTHYRSQYDVEIFNIFGGASIANITGDSLILPGTIRLISDKLPLPQLPGLYKAVFKIGLGDTPAQTETRYYLYLPPLAIAIFLLLAIITIIIFMQKRLHKNQLV